MAKELPYFKFEPSEWQNGDIQICSNEARITFIDICCSYWQRLGNLPYAFALQRHCLGNAELMQELKNASVIKVNDGLISINFLDEQLNELSEKSEKARKSALKRWDKSERNANASKTQSEGNANRREENRREKKRKEENIPSFSDFFEYAKSSKPKVDKQALKLKYDAWVVNDWKDGNDNKIKNWKSKLLNTLQYIKENEDRRPTENLVF